jgi:hypothetical protein
MVRPHSSTAAAKRSGGSDTWVKVEVSSGTFKLNSREYFTTSKRIQEITAPFVYVLKLSQREMVGLELLRVFASL